MRRARKAPKVTKNVLGLDQEIHTAPSHQSVLLLFVYLGTNVMNLQVGLALRSPCLSTKMTLTMLDHEANPQESFRDGKREQPSMRLSFKQIIKSAAHMAMTYSILFNESMITAVGH